MACCIDVLWRKWISFNELQSRSRPAWLRVLFKFLHNASPRQRGAHCGGSSRGSRASTTDPIFARSKPKSGHACQSCLSSADCVSAASFACCTRGRAGGTVCSSPVGVDVGSSSWALYKTRVTHSPAQILSVEKLAGRIVSHFFTTSRTSILDGAQYTTVARAPVGDQ